MGAAEGTWLSSPPHLNWPRTLWISCQSLKRCLIVNYDCRDLLLSSFQSVHYNSTVVMYYCWAFIVLTKKDIRSSISPLLDYQVVMYGIRIPLAPQLAPQRTMRDQSLSSRIKLSMPWSSGYGKRLMFQRLWVRIQALYTGWTWHFSHIFVVKIVMMCVWKDENKLKRGRGWPTLKKVIYAHHTLDLW